MKLLQAILFIILIRPLISIVIGMNIRNSQNLPLAGPAIVAANHNSHLDTLTLMSIWPIQKVHLVRPVAAADYFLSHWLLAWLSLNIMHILPIDRKRTDPKVDPLAAPRNALDQGEILLLFPEGSRGEPEQRSRYKTGIARLVEQRPDTPIIPVFMHGLGKSLPRGDFWLVPFFADAVIGDPIYWQGSIEETMEAYETAMETLAEELDIPEWE